MPELGEIYTADYFRRRFGYRGPYHRFTEAILEVFEPQSLADVGCGMGWIVEYLMPRLPVIGIEGSPAAIEQMKPRVRRLVHQHDLRGPAIPQMADHELVVSIEVAEHIEPEHAGAFLDWCTRGRRLLLTAAPPGQRGRHHVNCRPPEWWGARLGERGWMLSSALTAAWVAAARRRTGGCGWVLRNAMFFERGTDT